jgi:alpha-beta hydrolase superfamily lysophospholipase
MSGMGTANAGRTEPLYFGSSGELFGVYQPPERGRPRANAVVLCYPSGHEYQRVHRAFRNLAVSLARLGFPVLRFDYFGTGDSAGEASDATLIRWRADLSAAIDEVKRRSGARKVSLAGMRLGGTLACLESPTRSDLDVVVLWEPILRGSFYLQQLRGVERAWMSDVSRRSSNGGSDPNRHLAGTITAKMESEIAAVDLTTAPLPRATRAYALLEAELPEEAAWRERFRAAYGPTSCGILPAGADWLNPEAIHVALYPQAAQRTIVTLFDQVVL